MTAVAALGALSGITLVVILIGVVDLLHAVAEHRRAQASSILKACRAARYRG